MAHVIELSIKFDFRPTPDQSNWEVCEGVISGWRRTEEYVAGGVYRDELVVKLRTKSRLRRAIFPLARLDAGLQRACRAMDPFRADSDLEVQAACKAIKPIYLVRSIFPPHILDLNLKRYASSDAWEMRDQFLRAKLSQEGARDFLEKWGFWGGAIDVVELAALEELQREVRLALINHDPAWFARKDAFPHAWGRSVTHPYFVIETNRCETAILMTVTCDLLRRLKFKTCSRPDCRLPFALQTKHKRKFCSQYCAHLESVRRSRRLVKKNQKGLAK
jgi:hypothetical protein